ncbi:ATPase [Synergistales bacterium]|nr:ATPase [Synergistales bacterium]
MRRVYDANNRYGKSHLVLKLLTLVLDRLKRSFPVVLVTGARQVGKTTLLRQNSDAQSYYTFDDYVLLDSVKQDAIGFAANVSTPVILDEIQYAPLLFRAIKLRVDRDARSGEFLLTGSQQFEMMRGVSESLAGRIGILTLSGLSSREIGGSKFTLPFLTTTEYLSERQPSVSPLSSPELWRRIQRGSMPKLYADPEIDTQDYYSAYVKTYIERDVRTLTQVGDELTFMQFLTACAARTGALLNLSDISRDVNVSVPTAKRWLSILAVSGLVYLLRPFSQNITSRTVKTPKLYFMDTGLAAYLCKWYAPETLEVGAMSGAFFGTYIISEVVKSYQNFGQEPPLYFYRDADRHEVDLIIHKDGKIYPVEIKKTASPNAKDFKQFETLRNISGLEVAQGSVVCMYDSPLRLSGGNIIPVSYI